MEITLKELELKGACDLYKFKKLFGDRVEITEENCLLAIKAGFSLDWAAKNFFTPTALKTYQKATAPILKTYQKATGPSWEAFQKAKATAWKIFQKDIGPIWETYKKDIGPALKTYQKATAPILKTYQKAKATAFYKASLEESQWK